MLELIPPEILTIYKKFQNSGFEIYLVGGCVRNLLMKKAVKDWDFTTNATPGAVLKLFPSAFYDNRFGTVGLPLEISGKKQVIEVTTFRTEHGYIDRRRPAKIEWGKTIEEDLARRDFTVVRAVT